MPGIESDRKNTYVLVTPAHNEEAHIESTIRSVVNQSVRPLKWVIVSDASTDGTDAIVRKHAAANHWMELYRNEAGHQHNFAAQAHAINTGYGLVQAVDYDFIGTLDGDISLTADYYQILMDRLNSDPALGIVGGFIWEPRSGVFESRRGNRVWSVAGATQFFRRRCYEEVGGIQPLRYGGHDWYAEAEARRLGWKSRAFPDLKVFHHRPTGTAGNLVRHLFRQGRMDYSLGCDPIFEVVKCLSRFADRPVAIGTFARLAGFARSWLGRADREVPREFIRFLRKEQRRRLLSPVRTERGAEARASGSVAGTPLC